MTVFSGWQHCILLVGSHLHLTSTMALEAECTSETVAINVRLHCVTI
jgi:hypothetical protein